MSEPVIYPLARPIELKRKDGSIAETITELQLNRFGGASARKVLNAKDRGTGEFMAALISVSAGIPPSTVDQLDAEDLLKAGSIASDFFGMSLPT